MRRLTAAPINPDGGIHTTLATTGLNSARSGQQRLHHVRLSPDAVEALSDGNTYLLKGRMGGPYEVVGIIGWDTMAETLDGNSADGGEIVIAVGPAGGWSRGARLALSELSDPGVEIIGRRALP